jgi:Alpha galactosidase C-terminal beta sandwich domain
MKTTFLFLLTALTACWLPTLEARAAGEDPSTNRVKISALPALSIIAPGDEILVDHTNAGLGTFTSTRAPVLSLGDTLTPAISNLMAQSGVTPAGFKGDGSGVTNIAESGVVLPYYGSRRVPEPIMRIFNCFALCCNTPTTYTNVVTTMMGNGLFAAGFNAIDICGGCTGGDKGSIPYEVHRENGNLVWARGTNADFSTDDWSRAEIDLIPWLKRLGWTVVGYTEMGYSSTNNGAMGAPGSGNYAYPGSYGFETNDGAFFARWADAMWVDAAPDDNRDAVNGRMVRMLDCFHTNGPMDIRCSYSGAPIELGRACEFLNCVFLAGGTDADVTSPGYDGWASVLNNLDGCFSMTKWVRPGLYPDLQTTPWHFNFEPDLNSDTGMLTNDICAMRGEFTMACQLSCRMLVSSFDFTAMGLMAPYVKAVYCNPVFREVQYDLGPNTKVYTNSDAEVYCKHLGKEPMKWAVTLFNRSTNVVKTVTTTFAACGIPSGTWTVTDVNGQTSGPVTDTLTRSLHPMDAAMFIVDLGPTIYPTPSSTIAYTNSAFSRATVAATAASLFSDCVFCAPLSGDYRAYGAAGGTGTKSGAGYFTQGIGDSGAFTSPATDWGADKIEWGNWAVPSPASITVAAVVTVGGNPTNNASEYLSLGGAGFSQCPFYFISGPFGADAYMRFVIFTTANSQGIGQVLASAYHWVDGKPHLLVGTYDGTNTKLWIDGTAAVNALGGFQPTGDLKVQPSYLLSAGLGLNGGKVQNCLIFNHCFTSDEVVALKNYLLP